MSVAAFGPELTTSRISTMTRSLHFHDQEFDLEAFKTRFNRAYSIWFSTHSLPDDLRWQIENQEISMDLFDELTLRKELQRHISFIDSRIRFEEIPVAPHGNIIGILQSIISDQIGGTRGQSPFRMSNDDDCNLNRRNKKRPDAAFNLRPTQIPTPPPQWLKFKPDGNVFPNIVVEVAVSNEPPTRLLTDMQRYFSRGTSVRVWIGVKYWRAGRKFWCGWAERRPGGVGGKLHTNMQWPPHHQSINQPTNVVYSIPMTTVFGPHIPIPPNLGATLDIDTDEIQNEILEYV